jgi:hypothetical protein
MPDADHSPTVLQRIFTAGPGGIIQTAGLIFSLAAAVAFFYGIFSLIANRASVSAEKVEGSSIDVWREIVLPNIGVILICIIGILCASFALRLFSKAGSLSSQVIRAEDRQLLEPLIKEPRKDAISEYIRLASLSGFSGTFTKLGFTGLPLATVVLTLILLAISILSNDQELRKGVFDMAKLTLGAFLGSFVQRNIEQERLVRGQDTASKTHEPRPDDRPSDGKPGSGKDAEVRSSEVQADAGKPPESKPAENTPAG